MIRIVFVVVAVLLVAAPAILIATRLVAPAPVRVMLAAMAFVAPLAAIWAIHLVPAFNGQSPTQPAFWRGVGILLSASTLILPWLLYAALRDRLEPRRRP